MQLNQHLTNADAYPQFIVSKIANDGRGHTTKIPCNAKGFPASHKDPANWLTIEQAYAALTKLPDYYRLGFSITHESQYFFLDIDKCLIDGEWSQLAKDLCKAFTGCFVEVSQSGTGLHIIGRYTGEAPLHKNKNIGLNIELYTHDRYVMFGGNHPQGDWGFDATAAFNALIADYFFIDEAIADLIEDTVSDNLTDDEVLRRARDKASPQNIFGKGVSFDDLFLANVEVLARVYPAGSEGKPYNESSADLAMANMLVVHTTDKEQMLRIMRSSGLMRAKWDDRSSYLPDTVDKAIAGRTTLQLSQHKQSSEHNSNCQQLNGDMPQEFDGCYYVVAEREIYSLKYGMLNQEGFNLCFSSPSQISPYKSFKGKAQTCGRLVKYLGFRPDLPHGGITEREDDLYINTYKPLVVKKHQGDMEPFFRFFNKMFPDQRDQRIILSYVAVMAQQPGIKSQWCLVLQGVQGCGKSLFADFVAYACGEKYTHRAKGDEFENRFNSQWFGKTLLLVEDPRLKDGKFEEILKPLITQKSLSFEGKGKNAKMGDFPANFIITLNDFDILQKRKDARRLAVFMSALQTPEDIINSGLTPETFRKTVDWKNNKGNEIFAHFIHNYVPDPEFDFSRNCVTAPHTSTTDQAIQNCRSDSEMIIQEEIDAGRSGFCSGFISAHALTLLFQEIGKRGLLSPRQRGDLLRTMDFIHHPGLSDGKTGRVVQPDNVRTRLFIKKDHPTAQWIDREKIMKAYEEGQK